MPYAFLWKQAKLFILGRIPDNNVDDDDDKDAEEEEEIDKRIIAKLLCGKTPFRSICIST